MEERGRRTKRADEKQVDARMAWKAQNTTHGGSSASLGIPATALAPSFHRLRSSLLSLWSGNAGLPTFPPRSSFCPPSYARPLPPLYHLLDARASFSRVSECTRRSSFLFPSFQRLSRFRAHAHERTTACTSSPSSSPPPHRFQSSTMRWKEIFARPTRSHSMMVLFAASQCTWIRASRRTLSSCIIERGKSFLSWKSHSLKWIRFLCIYRGNILPWNIFHWLSRENYIVERFDNGYEEIRYFYK